ncbi:hypothetical protein [Paraburkholderia sediminicola]|uniref:hypothetical protein n=1 Tax=Paraburkholderia sediminicola TaxID=458836 RepID=UPI0038B6BD2B
MPDTNGAVTGPLTGHAIRAFVDAGSLGPSAKIARACASEFDGALVAGVDKGADADTGAGTSTAQAGAAGDTADLGNAQPANDTASNNANSMEEPDFANRHKQVFIGEIRVNRVGG